jgi:hypothetical protein
MLAGLERRSVGFAGADAYRLVETENEDLAVTDLAGFGGSGDGIDDFVDLFRRYRDLEL